MAINIEKCIVGLGIIALSACGGTSFKGTGKSSPPPAQPPNTSNVLAQPSPTPFIPPDIVPAQNGIPTAGPESDLTVNVFDTDSKMDVFRVSNAKTGNWLPLTWTQGTQTVKSACSPNSATVLSLDLHTAAGLFSSPTAFKAGSCNAPMTQTSPNTVDMFIDRGCSGSRKAHVTFQCSGSTQLQIQ